MVMIQKMLRKDVFPYLLFCSGLIFCTSFAIKGMFGISLWHTFMMFLGDWEWGNFMEEYTQTFSTYSSNHAISSNATIDGSIDAADKDVVNISFDDATALWKYLAQGFFVVYVIVTNIVLVNLLIAQMR